MRKTNAMPALDLLLGFEAAARHLSFTKAAAELFLTQSAISRQVQGLEDALGVPLFQRRHRALLLTDAGQHLLQTATDVLRQVQEAALRIRGSAAPRMLTVTTVMSFASLWLIPKLAEFRARHPEADVRISADNTVRDLVRDRIDVAIRYCAPENAPARAVKLFAEDIVMPVCAPKLLRDRARPLKRPEDLRHHVLLHDDYTPGTPWLEWGNWLASCGLAGLKPAGELRFSHYDQMIQAALEGQGVALGRLPLLSGPINSGRLVAAFGSRKNEFAESRAFFAIMAPGAAARPEVRDFIAWLKEEADREALAAAAPAPVAKRARRKG